MNDSVLEIQNGVSDDSPESLISYVLKKYGNKLVIASSLGLEDQVITHMATTINPQVRVFVLDTGRLHDETYRVLADTKKKYDVAYEIYFPNTTAVQDMVNAKGINLFYDNVENRKTCCAVRKVEPLNRALQTADAWITGLRQGQSQTRTKMHAVEWDASHNMVKINPLIHWNEADVWAYIHKHNVPYNSLHDKGFPSIGCAPCTRAIEPGEDLRAGRWWWEEPQHKECGLHVIDGKLVRTPKETKKEAFE